MRTPREALAYITRQINAGALLDKVGMCKRECREAYLIDSDGSDDATEAWDRTRYRIKGAWVPGMFLWWTGGGAGHGHVAIAGWRIGHIRTVDYPRTRRWNRTTVAKLEAAWPTIRYAGTSLDIDGELPRRHLPKIVRRWDHS
jgi:hypothetical protein